MDNTVNENWINNLVDELVDTKNKRTDDAVEINQFYNLLRLIFNNARLDYSGENMRIDNETAIFEYLKIIDPTGYNTRLDDLKIEREAEIEKIKEERKELKNAAQEAKGKEEA